MTSRRPVIFLCALSLLLATSLAAAGSAKGKLTVNDKTADLKYAYAAAKKNPFDKAKTDTYIILSDRELPAEAVHDEFALMRLDFAGLALDIDEDKQVIGCQIYSDGFKEGMKQISSTGNQKLETKSWTAEHVSGRVSIEPNTFFENKFVYDVSFDVPISAKPADKPLPGKPLPAGGGEPAKAWAAFRKALAAGDIATMKKNASADVAKQLDGPDVKEMLPLIQAMQPSKVKVVGGSVDGDKATLKAEGVESDGRTSNGTITLVKEGGQWKMMKESWETRSE